MMQGAVKDRGARQAISDSMAQRGLGGSGMELQAQLQGQQAAGDRDAMSGLNIAAQAQDRALQAIQGSGQLASQYRNQDFQEQAARAKAQDAINEFNARNLQGVQHANVGYQNRAQEMNLENAQNIANKNVDLANKEQQYNKELLQKQFDNQLAVANGMSGQYARQGQAAVRQGQQTANTIGSLGQGCTLTPLIKTLMRDKKIETLTVMVAVQVWRLITKRMINIQNLLNLVLLTSGVNYG
jgi:hypothetical protein